MKASLGPDDVESWIRERGLEWKIHVLPRPTRTVDEAAEALGEDPGNIVKTIIVVRGGETYAVIIPGNRKLDMAKLSRLVGEGARIASRDEVKERTGYVAGGVPPVALSPGVKLIVDSKVADKSKVYGGGGNQYSLLEFNPRELVRIVNPIVADISM